MIAFFDVLVGRPTTDAEVPMIDLEELRKLNRTSDPAPNEA